MLDGWTPFRAGWVDGAMTVDWCHLGAHRLTAPFFYETIALAIGHPFNAAFRQRTLADELRALSPGIQPSGFVFHMARCGSTLCAQVLAADPANIVVSEALPVRTMLEAPRHAPVEPARADAWLTGILNALGRKRFPQESRFFVKFMAADVLELPRISRLYPDVPWLFLYRDPLEILASQARQRGADTLRGVIPPALLGLTAEEVLASPDREYQLHVLAAFGSAALDGLAATPGRGLVLRYDDLPGALFQRLPAHFGMEPSRPARNAMEEALQRDAKAPGRPFTPDGEAKRREAAPWRGAADRICGAVFAALDAARLAGPRFDEPLVGPGP